MPKLSPRADLERLRQRAEELLRAAREGDPMVLRRLGEPITLAAAQLSVARTYGFAGWPKLTAELDRRAVLDSRDPDRLRALVAEHPDLAIEPMRNWRDHPLGASPLRYVAMKRCVVGEGVWRDMPGTGELARVLLDAGASVEGDPSDSETPLMTAASYGDIEVTAVLVAAGATVEGITQFAAAGDVSGWDLGALSDTDRVLGLIMAADHERLAVIDAFLDAGTPVDAEDEVWGRQALRLAASNGRVESVRHLLARGADPAHRDPAKGRTALDWCRRHNQADGSRHEQVEAILDAATPS